MAGVYAGRWGTCVLSALGLLLISVPRAEAVEALDGRIQAHGFLEMQIRSLDRDFSEELDLAQWYNVVNVELEVDILPDGWGPFDLLGAYVRVEGRFDCLYYDACGIFPSARTFGNKSRNLPLRLRDAYDQDYAGVIDSNDQANPPGRKMYRVPDDGDEARDPTGWVIEKANTLPITVPGEMQHPGLDYDPWLDNADADPALGYTNSYCPFNGLRGFSVVDAQGVVQPVGPARILSTNADGTPATWDEIGCYTNRPQKFEPEKRRGFPGFDTLFDIDGADGELGPSPDYFLADPNASVNYVRNDLLNEVTDQLRAKGLTEGSPTWSAELNKAMTLGYEKAIRGLAFERDDPAIYTLGVKVNTDIIGGVDVSTMQIEGRTQEEIKNEAAKIVYGESGDPNDPDCVGGYCEKIREAGQLTTGDPILDWKFTFRDLKGPDGGAGQTRILGPWLPKNFFTSQAVLSDRANPLRGRKTPTSLLRQALGGATSRGTGTRYHILDLASGAFDPTGMNPDPTVGNCGPGIDCAYGPDPVDPRVLKYEQLLIAAETYNAGVLPGDEIKIGGKINPAWFGPYPNNFLRNVGTVLTFGGDFSGIVPRYNTYLNRPQQGEPIGNTPYRNQITTSDIPPSSGFSSQATESTIAYTNIAVTGGFGELPMRPAPDRSNLSKLDPLQAQGLYIPSPGLLEALSTQDFDEHEFNIKEIDRAFNHGASQNDTYELKEAYLDMEFLDSRLWVRAGIQNIVWGKTELFRTTDQFNPVDMAMASLPGLEESRIGLLSARAVYSFYDVGPLEDVRLELAANFDRFKPADLGACGEPYTIDVVCTAAFGLAIHGAAGIGLAGVDRPPSAWNDVKGIEFGGRLEFRWDRFSFAVTDFYGYNDLPYPDPIFFYERNVDPNTGRMRKAGATGPCENASGFLVPRPGGNQILHAGNPRLEGLGTDRFGTDPSARPTGEGVPNATWDDYSRRMEAYTIQGIGIDEACLKPGGAPGYPNENRFDPSKALANPDDYPGLYWTGGAAPNSYIYQTLNQWQLEHSSKDYSLVYQPANQQFFAVLCSATITIAVSLTPGACGFNIFDSPKNLISLENVESPPFSEFLSVLGAGELDAQVPKLWWRLVIQNTKNTDARSVVPSSPLNRDVRDGLVTATTELILNAGQLEPGDSYLTYDSTLTNEQKALLGCGPFFGTRCDSAARYGLGNITLIGEGGGIDLLNAEASAILQSFPGIEGTGGAVTPRWVKIGEDPEYDTSVVPVDPADPSWGPQADPPKNEDREAVWVDTWVTWSDDPQPGTIGFEGGEYCTRYAPDSPLANELGIVRLPGCRGAKRTTVNPEPNYEVFVPFVGPVLYPTVEVLFEEHYTPRQDGCVFAKTMTDRDGTVYFVRAVGNEAARINAELDETCFNANAAQVSLRSTTRWTPTFDATDPAVYAPDYTLPRNDPVNIANAAQRRAITSTWPYVGQAQSVLGSRTLFHPLAGCESAGLDMSGDYQTWIGDPDKVYEKPSRDYGYVCDFRLRDYEADFIEGNAQVFRSEMANWSWNMLMFLMVTSCNSVSGGDDLADLDCFDPALAWDVTRCSFSTPQFCRNVKSFLAVGGTNRNHILAGGNERFGRRDFIWHSGGEAVLRYARRNVFGFSMDFAEDVSKTNWGLEFTWFGDMPFMNNNSWSALTDSQTLNLTVSIDRPTFINFLNANRTFFFNTQWFFQYLLDYDEGFTGTTGPFNALFTFAFFTGYFQDRLLPQMVTVYDFRSQSGGFLPSIQYRFNERFSVTIGISYFIGRGQFIPMPVRSLAPVSNRAGAHAYEDGTEFFISNIRHRDEAYMRIRWTF